jgi:hypothetical protein
MVSLLTSRAATRGGRSDVDPLRRRAWANLAPSRHRTNAEHARRRTRYLASNAPWRRAQLRGSARLEPAGMGQMMSPPVRPRLRHVIWPGNLPDSRKIEVLKASEVFRNFGKTPGTYVTLGCHAGRPTICALQAPRPHHVCHHARQRPRHSRERRPPRERAVRPASRAGRSDPEPLPWISAAAAPRTPFPRWPSSGLAAFPASPPVGAAAGEPPQARRLAVEQEGTPRF